MRSSENTEQPEACAANATDSDSIDSPVGDPAGGNGPPVRDKLVALVHGEGSEGRVQLWHTPSPTDGYATIPIAGHDENHPIRSTVFRDWLMMEYTVKYGRMPYEKALQEANVAIDAVARCAASDEHEIHVRVAEHDGMIFVDLGDPEWRAIKITSEGWEIVTDPPVKFKRTNAMKALPDPVGGGSIDELRPFVNVANDGDFRLLVACLLAMLRPQGPYPILILNGGAGSAKSTTAKIIRRLIDPAAPELRSPPRSEQDLAVAAYNSWVIAFDNLSGIRQHLSDAVCRLATGGGFGTRTLYTDRDETLIDACRPVVLNGIDSLVTPGGHNTDLFDRAVVLDLPAIAPTQIRAEQQLWTDFNAAAPRILGALLDAVRSALRNVAETELSSMPRMADFALWVTAAEEAFGWDRGSFMEAYTQAHRESEIDALQASAIYLPITRLLEQQNGMWRGTATKLLEALEVHVRLNRPANWPCDAARLSNELTHLKGAFAQVGVQIDRGKKAGSRYIDLRLVSDGAGQRVDTQLRPVPRTGVASDASDTDVSSLEEKEIEEGKKRIEGGTTQRPHRPPVPVPGSRSTVQSTYFLGRTRRK